jgi:hypothetical protein
MLIKFPLHVLRCYHNFLYTYFAAPQSKMLDTHYKYIFIKCTCTINRHSVHLICVECFYPNTLYSIDTRHTFCTDYAECFVTVTPSTNQTLGKNSLLDGDPMCSIYFIVCSITITLGGNETFSRKKKCAECLYPDTRHIFHFTECLSINTRYIFKCT